MLKRMRVCTTGYVDEHPEWCEGKSETYFGDGGTVTVPGVIADRDRFIHAADTTVPSEPKVAPSPGWPVGSAAVAERW